MSDDVIDLEARRAAKKKAEEPKPRGFRSWVDAGEVCVGIGDLSWAFRDTVGARQAANRLLHCIWELDRARFEVEGKCMSCGKVKGRGLGQCHGHNRWKRAVHYGVDDAVCATRGRHPHLSLTWDGVTCAKCLRRKPRAV